MALAAKRDARMDVTAFRLWTERRPEHGRREPLDGEPVLRAPPREGRHPLVASLIRRVGDRAGPGSATLSAALGDGAPIPDVAGRCGPPLPGPPIVRADEGPAEARRRSGDAGSLAVPGPGGRATRSGRHGAVPVSDISRGLAF
jgi:hypothetical protein